jgi:DNA (cytosine-5)-methyltransferase 1
VLNGLDLFSGIGGLSLSISEWVRPIAYCEINPYCQGVLLSQMANGNLPTAPIWDNISTFDPAAMQRGIDIIYAGFPCQDISVAGLGKGLAGERSGLFFEIVRLAKEIKPKFIFLENTRGILVNGGLQVAESLANIGYDCRFDIFSAEEFIDQRRERWFCLAKLNGQRRIERASEDIQSPRKTIVNEESSNYKLSSMECWASYARSMRKNEWLPFRMERIRSMGNSVCPAQCKKAFKKLMGMGIK